MKYATLMALTFVVAASGVRGATVWTASADRLEGEVSAITADGRLDFVRGGKTTSLLLRDLHRIRFREMPKAPAFEVDVRVTDGSMLRGKLVRPKHALGIRLPAAAQPVELQAGDLLGVRFVPAKGPAMPPDRFEQELARPKRNADALFVISPKGIVPLDVAVSKIAPDKVSFTWDRKDRSIDTARVAAVVFANQPQETQPPATVRLTDASVLRGRVLSLKSNVLTFELAGARLPVPIAGIVAIDFVNPNVTHLSDLKPAAVRETPFFNHIWRHRLDRSVGGRELTLDGRRYARGIGCHTRTELTYGLDGAYRTFAAVIGIDDEARPRGSVRFVVQADGKTIHAATLTGSDKATPIALNVAGVKKLTLLTDFADGANTGDHADWADARVVK